MIIESLLGLSLVLNVSRESTPPAPVVRNSLQLSVPQKDAALLPLVERTTRCIASNVVSDPRYRPDLRREQVLELIADSLDACTEPVNALVKTHDSMYGGGSGEAFLFGPYFTGLLGAVSAQARIRAGAHSR